MENNIISLATIKKIASTISPTKKLPSQNYMGYQSSSIKERQPEYCLQRIEFKATTSIARLEILQTQEYRTIDKYITRNYVKYPVYSYWKTRCKIIKKSIKLTNIELENLQNNSDELIALLAEDIVLQINKESLFPSWFLNLYLKRELAFDLQKLAESEDRLVNIKQQEIASCKEKIKSLTTTKNEKNKTLVSNQKFLDKTQKIFNRVCTLQKNILKAILSFGIYALMTSRKRKMRLEKKLQKFERKVSFFTSVIDKLANDILSLNTEVAEHENCIVQIHNDYQKERDERRFLYEQKKGLISPLQNKIRTDRKFIKLKDLAGLEYEKIIGVYVIHNVEKDKYYVGQSKDVMKRIKQHFVGTTPKNVIFAEDYYTSQFENKEDLFEIKIIKCDTKDELDNLEKKLIADYDSWNNGYNGTQGNT